MDATNHKKKKRKFKQTKQLVRMAINDGWTQTDIAKTCRTHQSIVSSWYKGSEDGTESQLKPLLDEYGHTTLNSCLLLLITLNINHVTTVFIPKFCRLGLNLHIVALGSLNIGMTH